MALLVVFFILEVLSFYSDSVLERRTKLSERNILLISQAIIFLIVSLLPFLGVPFIDPRNGKALVEEGMVFPAFLLALFFFLLFIGNVLIRGLNR